MFKHILLACFLLLTIANLTAQADSTDDELETTTTLTRTFKKGFYTNYGEFLKNEPSVMRSFETIKKTLSKENKAHANYRMLYKLDENEKPIKGEVWGFADDSLFYVKRFGSVFHTDYWKMECSAGEFPFAFVFSDQTVGMRGLGSIVNEVAPTYDLFVLTKTGKFKQGTVHYLNKLFSRDPIIQKEYDENKLKHKNWVKKNFLIRFNEALSKKNK
jgi:hypothetical protein